MKLDDLHLFAAYFKFKVACNYALGAIETAKSITLLPKLKKLLPLNEYNQYLKEKIYWNVKFRSTEWKLLPHRFYYGVKNPLLSYFLYNLGKAKIYLKEFREGLRILEEAELWLTTGLGASHPIVDELHQLTLLANEDREICLERWCTTVKKQGERQQAHQQHLPYMNSEDETLAKIFATLNQICHSSPQNLNGV